MKSMKELKQEYKTITGEIECKKNTSIGKPYEENTEDLENELIQIRTKLVTMIDFKEVIQDRLDISNKSYEISKDDKWIHIAIVLEGIIKEINGDDALSELNEGDKDGK